MGVIRMNEELEQEIVVLKYEIAHLEGTVAYELGNLEDDMCDVKEEKQPYMADHLKQIDNDIAELKKEGSEVIQKKKYELGEKKRELRAVLEGRGILK